MIGVPLGLLYSNAIEWLVHKYILHGLGKNKRSIWAFHWRDHHKRVRKHGMKDPDYQRPIWDWNARGKEAAGILALCAAHLPLAGIAPWFTASVFFSGANYLRKHKKSHTDPEWALRHMKWHVDHHLGKDQDKNWCVSYPWFDRLVGTRIDYPEESLRISAAAVERELKSGVYGVPEPEAAANDVGPADKPPLVAA